MSSPTTPSTPTKSYDANCHCGAVRYTVKTTPLESQKVTRCNCSICTKNGYYLIYPSPSDVVFHQGQEHLTSYRFASRKGQHKFCPTCGSSVLVTFNDGKSEMLALNVCRVLRPRLFGDDGLLDTDAMQVRLFRGVEVDKLDFNDFDGWNQLQPAYGV